MAKQKKKKNTVVSRRLYRKYIIEQKFNPYNPSKELMEEIDSWSVPSVAYIHKQIRGKKLTEIDDDQLFYVAQEMERGLPEVKLIAKMLYAIKYYTDLDEISREEMYEELTDKNESGFISEMYLEHLKPKTKITDMLKDIEWSKQR